MSKILIALRSSFWFVPALIAFAAACLALAAVELDGTVGREALLRYPRLFGAGAEGTRQLLSAIASSTITVAGVVFSITVVALSLAAAQYSPRVLRSFMRDRANQSVLGIFLGVYVYCLLVLRTIRGGEQEFVPAISTVGAIALALVGVAFLIFFIHHIATSIQVSEIAARVAADTMAAVEAEGDRKVRTDGEVPSTDGSDWKAVQAASTGYIQSIDYRRLVELARAADVLIRLGRGPGDFVVHGEALACVGAANADDRVASGINSACAVNTYRDIAQDPGFGVQQLVDIALKALSPGVNDTATARTCLDYLTAVLIALMKRNPSPELRLEDEAGKLRVIAPGPSLEIFINSTFDAIRRNSGDNVDMLLHTARALERIAAFAPASAHTAIRRQLEALHESLRAGGYVSGDRQQLEAAVARSNAALVRGSG